MAVDLGSNPAHDLVVGALELDLLGVGGDLALYVLVAVVGARDGHAHNAEVVLAVRFVPL